MLDLLKYNIQFSRLFFTRLDALARHRLASIAVIACLSFGGSWLFSVFKGTPVPWVHDEYSYLLAGDTFAHGRITNPTHPMWEHFETFHELMVPTYMSQYPPGQGLFLAAGQVIFGHPIYGVWLSTGLMSAAICWMLYGWLAPRWALVGGIVAVLQFGVFTYWSQSYWGGAVAALGGALVFGALPRIVKYQRLRDTVFLGLGIGILVNTRPLEGIIFGIPLGFLLLPWKIKWPLLDKRRLLKNALLPLILLVLAIALLTGAYNKKITGNAFELPYTVYSKQYMSIPIFIWQPLPPTVHYNHKAINDFMNGYSVDYYRKKKSWEGFILDFSEDNRHLIMFFLGFPLALPSLAIIFLIFCHPKTACRCLLSLGIIFFTMILLTYSAKPHYIASLTCFVVLLITTGLRALYGLRSRRLLVGPMMVTFLISLQLLLNILWTPVRPAVKSLAKSTFSSFQMNLPQSFSREQLINILLKRGGKYLIIVQYPFWHDSFREWVFNDADIDGSPIIWARDMGAYKNTRILQYFKDRQVLFINIVWDIKLYPYYGARQ